MNQTWHHVFCQPAWLEYLLLVQGQTFPAVLNDSGLSGQSGSSGQQVILVSHHSQSTNGASDNGYNVSVFVVVCAAWHLGVDLSNKSWSWFCIDELSTGSIHSDGLPVLTNTFLPVDMYSDMKRNQRLPGRCKKTNKHKSHRYTLDFQTRPASFNHSHLFSSLLYKMEKYYIAFPMLV